MQWKGFQVMDMNMDTSTVSNRFKRQDDRAVLVRICHAGNENWKRYRSKKANGRKYAV
jgi:hypothetical protein